MPSFKLEDSRSLDVNVSGGKGASLSRLKKLGFRVPDALIVSTSFNDSLDLESLTAISDFIQSRALSLFAVRSSALDEDGANNSFAGQHETILNVNPTEVLPAINKVLQSFTSARANLYRQERGLSAASGGAVIIQEMLRPDFAGVAFSLDPRHGQSEYAVIEYIEGLGDRLVSGEVTPSRATVRMSTLKVSGDDQNGKLNSTFKELAVAADTCAKEWETPVDIEFAIVGEQLFLLQCRPITTFIDDGRPVFELSFTRSMTIMQQAAWHKVYKQSAKKLYGWESPFDSPPTLFFLNDHSVEVWENAKALDWFIAQVQETNVGDPQFFWRVFEEYEAGYHLILRNNEKGGTETLEELDAFLDIVYPFALHFAFLYYTSINEKTPEPQRSAAVEWRTKDHSWEDLSASLIKNIRRVFPDAIGREMAIVPEDLSNPPSIKSLDQRLEHFVYIPDVYRCIESLDESTYINERFKLIHPRPDPALLLANQLAGESVFGAKVKGKVRIVRHKGDLQSFQAGDILVSPMTTPDFLSAMTIASAILTDEGGVLCHAAIVARELKIPCVVGLRALSKLVKNGDYVEVDGERGMVTIIR